MKIQSVQGREIIDSRGNPTVEVDVTLDGGAFGRAAVPSGASTGQREALELRDGDKKRYLGKGVTTAVSHVNGEIAKALAGRDADQRAIDTALIDLDGTPNKGRLGANALLGVSMALARANAAARGVRSTRISARSTAVGAGSVLPVPMMNILNGGAHADSSVDFQEFMVMPVGALLVRRGGAVRRRDLPHAARHPEEEGTLDRRRRRGGLRAQPLVQPRSARRRPRGGRPGRLQTGRDRVSRARRRLERAVERRDQTYEFKKSSDKTRSADEMVTLYEDWVRQYPIISIEDGLAEGDWDGWKTLTRALGDRVQLVGDDVFVTNPEILQRGITEGIANALLVKLNQIGTVSETLDAVAMARDAGYASVISHRSGETEDTTIADLAVATNAGQIKTGSASRTDRVAKYNQLLRIEEELGSSGRYAGTSAIRQLRAR